MTAYIILESISFLLPIISFVSPLFVLSNFSQNTFSGTMAARIFKFSANLGYGKLYRVQGVKKFEDIKVLLIFTIES